jgi:cell division septal protein FtsQ
LLSNELSEFGVNTQLCVEVVPLAETDSLETQIVHDNKHNIRLELRQNNVLRLCEDDYGAEVKHYIESDKLLIQPQVRKTYPLPDTDPALPGD